MTNRDFRFVLVLACVMLAAVTAVHANGGPSLSPAESFLAIFSFSPFFIIVYGMPAIVGIVFGRRFGASWYTLFSVFISFPFGLLFLMRLSGFFWLFPILMACFCGMLAFAASELSKFFPPVRVFQDVFNRLSVIRKLLLTVIIYGIFIAMPFLAVAFYKLRWLSVDFFRGLAGIWFAEIIALVVVIAILRAVGKRLENWPARPLQPQLTDYAWFAGLLVLFLLALILG